MSESSLSFQPVMGSESIIKLQTKQDGKVYFATDTGKMFLDAHGKRVSVGGAGAAIYYAEAASVVQDEDENWVIYKTDLKNPADAPARNDIILNETDGAFYKVEVITTSAFLCSRIAISGNGTGVATETRPDLLLEELETTNIINGSDIRLYFTATSKNDESGNPLNNKLTITWKLFEGDSETGTMYYSSSFQVDSGVRSYLDFGGYLRNSTTSTIQLVASGNNHDKVSRQREGVVTTTELSLSLSSTFSNKDPFEADAVNFTVYAVGNIDKIMDIKLDDAIIETKIIPVSNSNDTWDLTIPKEKCTHGAHSVQVDLYQSVNGARGESATPIKFEIAVKGAENTPIVWLGEYQSEYFTYDSIQIPYLAWDPNSPNEATIYLYKDGIQYKDEERVVTDRSAFSIWEIADADFPVDDTGYENNTYQIACGTTNEMREASMRTITFKGLKDKRDLSVAKQNYLRLNFDPKGRSNSESKTKRARWSYTDNQKNTINAAFENFNWYNNGWGMDSSNNNTYLRISNGAKFSLPLGVTRFAGNTTSTQSHTFELMFKIRNVQDYTDLITNVTRYTFGEEKASDDEWYEQFKAQSVYTNYDAFLQALLGADYDKLEFAYVEKIINVENAICKYFTGQGQNVLGWALGPQDAFFKDGKKTVSVSYTENDLVSLSIVFKYDSAGKTMILFYLNGVITGVAYTDVSSFSVGDEDHFPSIEFDSSKCDIDLYKLRVYNTALNVSEVVKNYTIDRKDIDNFDMLSLAKENNAIGEYQLQFDKVVAWNKEHPNNQTMPYIIFDTTNSPNEDRLPWSKSVSIPTTITFVNTQLDYAYASGELEQLAIADKLCKADDDADTKAAAIKKYYKYHCPSWTGDNCELVVQGTSSEYYPRRNYKIKTKTEYDADGEERIHIFLNEGPFAEDYRNNPESTRQKYWYLNNYTNGTHKWTMKVDYMESSGSYNAGFASLVGNSYTKHPLKDYLDAGAIDAVVTQDEDKNPVTPYNGLIPQDVTFTEVLDPDSLSNSNIRWQDYRTSLLGFPVMAFHKKSDGSYTFIGYYRMLLDKGSDEVLGFKPPKGVTAKFLGNKNVRKKAECWEFSNNNRTYCSYRDPWDRVELSFMPPEDKITDGTGLTAAGVPIVADSFEYRYNDNEDYLDILYGLGKKSDGKWTYTGSVEDAAKFLEETDIDITSTDNWPAAREQMIEYYSNWEKACQWLWSTCTDNVVSMGRYEIAPVGNVPFTTDGSLYIENSEGGFTQILADDTFNVELRYFKREVTTDEETDEEIISWPRVFVYDPSNIDASGNPKYLYVTNKFYQSIDGVYSLIENAEFDPDISYYELIIDDAYKAKSDLLVTKASAYVEGTQYYTWNKQATTESVREGTPSVQAATVTGAEQFAAGDYYVAAPVTYGTGSGARTYHYDTQEYRAEKFIKELPNHFDLEYLSTYFIMTEVFECYDSRGKNCMMASWGPLVEGGDWIWYPIFYDIDTQLGINNTGIPSFTFNIDATLNDNFSTSDSILWNNFYAYFKGSYILQKYRHLKGLDSTIFTTALSAPPLYSVKNLENWYLFKPEATKNIATRGLRPLIATNLDAWYKYITITNIVGSTNEDLLNSGAVGYLNRTGGWTIDSNGTYFYALQGDRSQSRQSFLSKRIDYTDSWLGVGDYERSGNNCIWGRVSANDASDTSDKWLEGSPAGETYWADDKETIKTHAFDAQYWLDLTPIYSTYVTISDDAAAYPPTRYDGITPVNFRVDAIESGVRKSKNYKEQLLYIYGSDKMLDIGDMSNLYWREFKIDGKASKLTRLKLGHDGIVNDYTYVNGEKVYSNMPWKNGYLNQPSIPAGLGSTGMPLLKEANFCNITIQSGGSDPTLDLVTCEKLENFRATGSNLTSVTFAKGVALNTLYLPASITNLSLVEANLLTNVLKSYTVPTKTATGDLQAVPGLYLESFFEENATSSLTNLNLEGGSLGYGSFDLFKRFYELRKGTKGNRLTMLNVEWCPYVQLVDGDAYDKNVKYYKDNGHYGLEEYTYTTDTEFRAAIVRGELYYLNQSYVLVAADAEYDETLRYFTKNSTTGLFVEYSDNSDFAAQVEAQTLYYLDDSIVQKSVEVDQSIYNALKDLITDTNFRSVEDSEAHANFSGIIYINNSTEIDEYEIADTMQAAYPKLKFFVADAKEAYSAQFVVLDENGSYFYVPDINGDDTYESIQKVSQGQFAGGTLVFGNPFNLYDPSDSKAHYDFIGWTTSLTPDLVNYSNVLLASESAYWGISDSNNENYNYKGTKWGVIESGVYSQIYYAVFIGTTYTATFKDAKNPAYSEEVKVQYDPNGSYFHANVKEPQSTASVRDEERYALRGWTETQSYSDSYSAEANVDPYLTNVSKIRATSDITLWAVYQLESVYDSVTDMKYFMFDRISDSNKGTGYRIKIDPDQAANLTGKITLPAKYNGENIVCLGNCAGAPYVTHVFFEPGSLYESVDDAAWELSSQSATHSLKAVYLPDSMRWIGQNAFHYQQKLETITLSDNITYIGYQAFRPKTVEAGSNLKLDHLPANLVEIGSEAFTYCSGITITKLPPKLKKIGDKAFRRCPNVAIEEFGGEGGVSYDTLTYIGVEAFMPAANSTGNHQSIRQVYVYDSVQTIGDGAFENYGYQGKIPMYIYHDSIPTGWDAAEIGVQSISPGFTPT